MLKIIIKNATSETVIHNVYKEDLAFWRDLLDHANVKGEVIVVETAA